MPADLEAAVRAAILQQLQRTSAAETSRLLGMHRHTLTAIAVGAPVQRGTLLLAERALRERGLLAPVPAAISTVPVIRG